MLSGVSILNFSDFRYLLRRLRTRIGLRLLGFGTKKSVEESQSCLSLDLFAFFWLCACNASIRYMIHNTIYI